MTHDPARVRLIRSNLILAQVNVANGEVSLIQTIIVSNAGTADVRCPTRDGQSRADRAARRRRRRGAADRGTARGHGRDGRWRLGAGHTVPAGRDAADDGLHPRHMPDHGSPSPSPSCKPIGQLRVLVPARGVQVESDDLRPFGVTALGGNSFTAVGATDLLPGVPIRFTLLGSAPRRAAGAMGQTDGRCKLALPQPRRPVLATLGVLAWADPRGRRAPAPTPQPTEIERLVADIRALADKEDPAAQLQRRALKARLLELAPDIASSDRSGPRSAAAKTDVALRLCEESDLPKLEWSGTFTDQRELIRRAFERKQEGEVEMVVADIDGFPVGQIWIDFSKVRNEHTAVLWALRVLPNLQNKGIGTKLITRAVEMSRGKGC